MNFSPCSGITLMGLHDGILKVLTKELADRVAHFGAADIKDMKKNSEELVQAFQRRISKKYCSCLFNVVCLA